MTIPLIRQDASENQTGESSYSIIRSGMSNDFIDKTNLIHNGALKIIQRYGVAEAFTRNITTATDNVFHFDRWGSYCAGTTAKGYTITGDYDAADYAQVGMYHNRCFKYTQNTTTTTAQTAAADDTIEPFVYGMEGYDYSKIHGKAVTIMFWVKCSRIGTYTCYLGTTSTRAYVTTFTVSASNVWEQKIINLTLDTSTGSYSFDNNIGLWIGFFGYGGTNFQTATLNTWIAGKYCQYSGATALQATDTFKIGFIQLLQGTVTSANNVKYQDYGKSFKEEIEVCQRYYEKTYNFTAAPGASTLVGMYRTQQMYSGTNAAEMTSDFKVQKRIAPVYSYFWDDVGNASRVFRNSSNQLGSIITTSDRSIVIIADSTGNSSQFRVHYVVDADFY